MKMEEGLVLAASPGAPEQQLDSFEFSESDMDNPVSDE
jgi:hypothetical protein